MTVWIHVVKVFLWEWRDGAESALSASLPDGAPEVQGNVNVHCAGKVGPKPEPMETLLCKNKINVS